MSSACFAAAFALDFFFSASSEESSSLSGFFGFLSFLELDDAEFGITTPAGTFSDFGFFSGGGGTELDDGFEELEEASVVVVPGDEADDELEVPTGTSKGWRFAIPFGRCASATLP